MLYRSGPSKLVSGAAELDRHARYRSHMEELAAADIGLMGHIDSSWPLSEIILVYSKRLEAISWLWLLYAEMPKRCPESTFGERRGELVYSVSISVGD